MDILDKELCQNCHFINNNYKLTSYIVQSCDGFSHTNQGNEINHSEFKKIVDNINKADQEKRIIKCICSEKKINLCYKNYVQGKNGPYDTVIANFEKIN